jgi:nicotinate-nucleotide adenylyltransferase
MTTSKNIGIYGGAFDPPHVVHVDLAKTVISQFKLDQLLIIPTGDAVHKRRHLTAGHHRVAMAKLAFAHVDHAVVDECEMKRGGASYTIDTLTELKTRYPDARFTLIIGLDQLTAFHTWKNYKDILQQAHLAVALRGGESISVPPDIAFTSIDFEPRAMSSSDLRQMIRMKDTQFAAKMTPSVAAYIQEHQLYLT